MLFIFFFLMIRRPPRSTLDRSSAASDVYKRQALASVLLFAGTVIFCGTLYLLALGGPLWLGMVTPAGGTLMLGGWACLLYTSPSPRDRTRSRMPSSA